MGKKEGDLWDDSALIAAFDHAISTYKKMHISGKNKDAAAQEAETVIGEEASYVDFASSHATRDADTNDHIPATDVPDSGETRNEPKLEEDHHVESLVEQPCLDSTSGQGIQSGQSGYAYAEGVDDYNQLVTQYYELEEKRAKILEQLNQYGYWNYQNVAAVSSSGVPYSDSQEYSMAAYQVSDPNAVCTCCPCYSQCLREPRTSIPGCSLGELSVGKPCNNAYVEMDHKMSFPYKDDDIRKMAMGAAEKALSTIRTTISGDFNANEDAISGKERNNSEHEEISGLETDLAAVLNAWYSAGFCTGKYIVEQSIRNRRQM
ncbi:uncharacterized protein LOC106777091 [Vigna radiata var. radiata]|uniref:Uncharacterized protein LOC106777091 n=1 Tax=Vigna radiata var. radiata TaxID=3916 RepID=A0A1S3VP77_VIGRR|nr:uncharacterized protein LOC106777091 [Vigna radiata var. radiata]